MIANAFEIVSRGKSSPIAPLFSLSDSQEESHLSPFLKRRGMHLISPNRVFS